jgi:hypothetical protein
MRPHEKRGPHRSCSFLQLVKIASHQPGISRCHDTIEQVTGELPCIRGAKESSSLRCTLMMSPLQLGFTKTSSGFRPSAISESAAAQCRLVIASLVVIQEGRLALDPISTRRRGRTSSRVRDPCFRTDSLGRMAGEEWNPGGREAHVGVRWSECLF